MTTQPSEIPTPRTDAAAFCYEYGTNGMFGHEARFAVCVGFSRSLEREVITLQQQLAELKAKCEPKTLKCDCEIYQHCAICDPNFIKQPAKNKSTN